MDFEVVDDSLRSTGPTRMIYSPSLAVRQAMVEGKTVFVPLEDNEWFVLQNRFRQYFYTHGQKIVSRKIEKDNVLGLLMWVDEAP